MCAKCMQLNVYYTYTTQCVLNTICVLNFLYVVNTLCVLNIISVVNTLSVLNICVLHVLNIIYIYSMNATQCVLYIYS